MNYYERHIGDYAKDTAHLSLLEHGVYSRLLDVYYTRESPIPKEHVYRLIGCRSPQDRKSCDLVLGEFFHLVDGAWRQSRCDAEIEKFVAGAPEREAKQANRDLRWKKHRRERADMFRKLHAVGQHAEWNIPIKELRGLVERYCDGTATPAVAGATETATPPTRAATAPSPSPQSQSQSPIPRTQSITHGAERAPATPATPPATGRTESNARSGDSTTAEIQALYPQGVYRQSSWLLAERQIRALIDHDVDPDTLVACARDYAAQQAAKGSIGTQFVLAPDKFFGPDNHWRGPFPLPKSPTETRSDELLAHLQRRTGSNP